MLFEKPKCQERGNPHIEFLLNVSKLFFVSFCRQYVIIAPKKVRSDGVYRVHVSLFRMAAQSIRLRASLSSQVH